MPDYNVILNAVKNLVLQPCHSERSEESLINIAIYSTAFRMAIIKAQMIMRLTNWLLRVLLFFAKFYRGDENVKKAK